MKIFRLNLPKSNIPFRKLPTICITAFFFTTVILLTREYNVINDAPVTTVPTCVENKAMDFMKFSEEILRRDDVYADLSPLHDTHTYGSKKKLIKFALQRYISLDSNNSSSKKTIRIVEIGAYRGEFTNEIANACTELAADYKCAIIAIDIWNGIEDDAFSASIESLEAFKRNVIFFNNTKTIAPLRNTASQAFALLNCYNIQIDIVYFDFSTSYSSTKNQLDQYHSLMNGPGVLFGTTFCGPGAYRAVRIFAETNSHKFINTTSINECTWMIVKAN